MSKNVIQNELNKLDQAISAQEALRGILPEEQLQAALAALQTQRQLLLANLQGGGAVAQDEATAIGERGVQAQNVGGSVITGDHNIQAETVTIHTTPQPESAAAKALPRYLSRLQQRCNVLPLAALGSDEGTGDEVGLDKVYVDLDTQTRLDEPEDAHKRQPLEREEKRLSALDAATQYPRLALLGDPGSGKSSFVRQLVAWLAAARLGSQKAPSGWRPLLPLFVVLRDLVPRLAALDLAGLSAEEQQQRLSTAVWAQWQADLTRFKAADLLADLADILDAGDVLLVFDGLDEVPVDLRQRVRQAVAAILTEHGSVAHVIVTCRVRSYTGETVLPGFKSHTLAPFDKEKIGQFVDGWYRAQVNLERLARQDADAKAADLRVAATAPALLELAANPMLLTTMAIIHQKEVGLPNERVRLYAQAVGVLLTRWQKRKGIPVSAALTAVLDDNRKLRAILERLGYAAHRLQAAEEGADLSRKDILALLEAPAFLGDMALAAEFLDYVDQRSGLLVGRGGDASGGKPPLYTFPHRSFQEYLAGCYMVTGRAAARKYWQHAAEGDYYYLAGQLGAEELLFNKQMDAVFLDLAYDLCPQAAPQDEVEWRALLWSGHMAAVLGAAEIKRDDKRGGGQAYWQRIRARLPLALRSPLPALERVEAGRILAHVGDPRLEVMDVDKMQFCLVPAGKFIMGGGDDDPLAEDHEKPQHEVDLAYDFWIGRYPITNAQFNFFVEDDGYGEAVFWLEAAKEGYWQNGRFKGRFDNDWRVSSLDFGSPFNFSNHPVVGVSWYEALAFTRWLTLRWQQAGLLPDEFNVQLPSEAEWEKAARGGLKVVETPIFTSAGNWKAEYMLAANPEPTQRYPWGDQLEADKINYKETGVGATNAVGAFLWDEGVYGVYEMGGNVNEWTRSLNTEYPYRAEDGRERLKSDAVRIIRGGSYFDDQTWPRCAYRSWGYPNGWDLSLGFRVVVSPLSLRSAASDL